MKNEEKIIIGVTSVAAICVVGYFIWRRNQTAVTTSATPTISSGGICSSQLCQQQTFTPPINTNPLPVVPAVCIPKYVSPPTPSVTTTKANVYNDFLVGCQTPTTVQNTSHTTPKIAPNSNTVLLNINKEYDNLAKIVDNVIGGTSAAPPLPPKQGCSVSATHKKSSTNSQALTQSAASGNSPRPSSVLQSSDLSQASYAVIHFLFSRLDGVNALSLQNKYNLALNNNDADAMSTVYYACINELKSNFLSKNPSYTQRNNFQLLFGLATNPESNGGAVACVNALISYVKNPN